MPILVAPKTANEQTEPCVGIFWLVDAFLVVDRSTIEEAETYGDCITHEGGHYEKWEGWQALGATRLAQLGFPTSIRRTEYDEWPRGRVVYEVPEDRFVIYADRRLQKAEIMERLKEVLGLLSCKITLKSDPHYR